MNGTADEDTVCQQCMKEQNGQKEIHCRIAEALWIWTIFAPSTMSNCGVILKQICFGIILVSAFGFLPGWFPGNVYSFDLFF